MQSSNITKLKRVIFNLEEQMIWARMKIQHWKYTFKEDYRPVVAVRTTGEYPQVFTIHKIKLISDCPEQDPEEYLEISGTINGQPASFRLDERAILPGEMHFIIKAIPEIWRDQHVIENGWKTLDGEHHVKDCIGNPARVIIDAKNRTLSVVNNKDRNDYKGTAADEFIHDAVERIFNGKTLLEGVQYIYDQSYIDLPF